MFQKKKLLPLIAVSALLAACGGGDDTAPVASGTTATNTTPATATPSGTSSPGATAPGTATGTTPGTTAGTTPAGSGNTPTAGGTPSTPNAGSTPGASDPTPVAVTDQRFNGHMTLVSNQILYLRTNRYLYLPVTLNTFESPTGIVDLASGSPVAHLPNLAADAAASGCTIEIDGTCAIQPPAVAPAAPIAAFGIRIGTHLLPSETGQQVGNQRVVGRIAFDLTERAGSPGVGAGQVPEVMRFVIDNVEMATDQNGRLTSVRLLDTARLHVYGRSAAGVEVRESLPAPAGTVRLLPLTQVPDGYGDTGSVILFMDLETGFSQAGDRLAALQSIAGHFTMHVTLSSVSKIVRPAAVASPGFPAVPLKDLIGQSITVNTQPPVTGGGISGSAWIRMYPAQ
ncbi:MAG TPA: hypothetical protein VEC01_16070 [Noviherbaspirillum sp.]|uniref:hypothetical protein n=1 Tax=Noviherbaspirillum sp. TaxID=1926288 RepID=UPI002D45E707|nr:hypothetical protein [Noviherbaspirillum sp.]HYD96847.1 hypothetical protein [Noviherbaspirillum sp.]